MKKFLLACLLGFGLSLSSGAQIIFFEDFDGIPGPTGGGAGTYLFPSGWLLRNVDNRVPAPQVAYVNEAWERREDFNFNVADSCAFSTSWYSPVGPADDWMWTPVINALPANAVLSWNAVAYDPLYPDGYEVRIMTQTSSPGGPTGGTGVMGNQVTNSTQIFSIANEASAWTPHTVSLSAYAGENVWIAWRNNSNNQFLLLIDDIKVEVQENYDAFISVLDTATEYTEIPKHQPHAIILAGDITNDGVNPMTNVQVHAEIFGSANNLVYQNSSNVIASLGSNATSAFTIPSYTVSAPDTFTIQYSITSTEVDDNGANDTMTATYVVTDTVFSRDNGVATGTLGIGAGNGGYLGQDFEILSTDSLTSISWAVGRGYTGRPYAACVWDMVGGVPNSIIASTDTLLYADDSARFMTVPIHGGPVALTPGRYAVTVIEFSADSTIALSQSASFFTAGRVWVNWPTIPTGTWTHVEDFGQNFARSYILRMNLGYNCNYLQTLTTPVAASCSGCNDGSGSVVVSGANGNLTYSWSNGDTTAMTDSLSAGTYYVTVVDEEGCTTMDSVTITEPVLTANIYSDELISTFPNPTSGAVTVQFSNGVAFNEGVCEIFNSYGQIIYSQNMAAGSASMQVDLTGMAKGIYMLQIRETNGTLYRSQIVLK